MIFEICFLKCCILLPINLRNPKRICRDTCCLTHHEENKPSIQSRLQISTTILIEIIQRRLCFLKRELFFIRYDTLHLWRQRSIDQDDHKREEARQWDMFPGPTELRLIGYLTESTWTPKSISNMLTPKTNSQTYWQRALSQVMSGTIFSICVTSSISALPATPKRCRK